LTRTVATKIQLNCSPEQIAGWVKIEYPNEENNRVSHETIYYSLFVQIQGIFKKELQQYLGSQRTIWFYKHANLKEIRTTMLYRSVSASVEDYALPGHWEDDLIAGQNNSYIATLVERHTSYVMLEKVKNKDTESVVSALIKQSKKLPDKFYKLLTWDRGTELADHERFILETDINVYL
jgi:IS30 family transposase